MPRGTIPAEDNKLLAFATELSAAITAGPVPLSLTAAMATTLAGFVTAFSTKLAAAQSGTARGPYSIYQKDEAKKSLVDYLRVCIRQIQGSSTVSDDQRRALKLPVRHAATTPAEPGTANRFKVVISPVTGELDLSWKCSSPTSGTMYQVFRKIGTAQPTYIGGVGAKKITDVLPAATSQVTYMVQAVRSTGKGAWASFVVNLSAGSGGEMVAKVTDASPVKIAA